MAKKCNNGREYGVTRSGREGPGTPEFQRKSEEYEETRRIPKLRHRHTISIYLLPTYPHVRQRYGLSPGLRRRACSFIRHDPTQSSLTTLLLATCIEKVVYMKSGEELHNKVYQSPRSLRNTVLKPNLHHGRLDLSNLEARTSVDHQSKESEEYGKTRSEEFVETRSGNIDFRIPGLPHSTVQKEDDVRRETVKKLTDQFETHPNRESLKADLEKNQKFNLFSEKTKELTRSMGNTESFEMCEITSKVQCQDRLLYCEIGIVYCTCGECLQPFGKKSTVEQGER